MKFQPTIRTIARHRMAWKKLRRVPRVLRREYGETYFPYIGYAYRFTRAQCIEAGLVKGYRIKRFKLRGLGITIRHQTRPMLAYEWR